MRADQCMWIKFIVINCDIFIYTRWISDQQPQLAHLLVDTPFLWGVASTLGQHHLFCESELNLKIAAGGAKTLSIAGSKYRIGYPFKQYWKEAKIGGGVHSIKETHISSYYYGHISWPWAFTSSHSPLTESPCYGSSSNIHIHTLTQSHAYIYIRTRHLHTMPDDKLKTLTVCPWCNLTHSLPDYNRWSDGVVAYCFNRKYLYQLSVCCCHQRTLAFLWPIDISKCWMSYFVTYLLYGLNRSMLSCIWVPW